VERFFRADLSVPSEIDQVVEALPSRLNGLANVAGLPPTHAAGQVLRVNLLAVKRLTLGLIGKLADGASIVNVASLAGQGWADALPQIRSAESVNFAEAEVFCKTQGIEGARSYFFTKEALIVWTMQNRWTWRDHGIRMNAVSPGPVETPILPDFLNTLGARAEEDVRTMDRAGRPDDIAPLIVFLLSDGSRWIRGSNIDVDGGMHSHIIASAHNL
jgi:NAD(P)-dependent dehydrogenase (short-subunit alcohol dehydrogenase family)